MMKYEKINKDYAKLKKLSDDYYNNKNYEKALRMLSVLSSYMYNINTQYYDSDVENLIQSISKQLIKHSSDFICIERNIIFYDGFGLDTRGLALIYLKALINLKYRITYITFEDKKEHIPTIKEVLNKNPDSKLYYISKKSYLSSILEIDKVIKESNSLSIMIYTKPFDLVGLTTFSGYNDICKRYLINLTDHAFWIGKTVADFFIEYRNYGASISIEKRKILPEKLLKLPFYPNIDTAIEFQGLPFNYKDKQLIFSGGSLYKTIDAGNTYYEIVEFIISNYEKTIFLYAGSGEDKELKKLIRKYPNRIYHITERRDILEIMKRCYFYLSTYPISGGLMTQIAVKAGKLPLTVTDKDINPEVLLDPKSLGIEFDDVNELYIEINKLLTDVEYKNKKEMTLGGQLVEEIDFQSNLKLILDKNLSNYKIIPEEVNTLQFQKLYIDKLKFGDYCKLFVKSDNFFIFRHFTCYYLFGILIIIKSKIKKVIK